MEKERALNGGGNGAAGEEDGDVVRAVNEQG